MYVHVFIQVLKQEWIRSCARTTLHEAWLQIDAWSKISDVDIEH